MIEVEIDSKSTRRLINSILTRGKRLPLRRISVIGYRSVLRNFQMQGRPDRWAPLSARYIKSKPTRGTGMILQDEGNLKKNIHPEVLGGDNIAVSTGPDQVYAAAQNFGYKPRNLPPRPFMLWQQEDIEKIDEVLLNHLVGKK